MATYQKEVSFFEKCALQCDVKNRRMKVVWKCQADVDNSVSKKRCLKNLKNS